MTVLGTSEISISDRPRFWADSLSELCGKLHTDSYGAKTIDGQIEYGALGRLKLCQIEASRHRVALPTDWAGDGKHPVIKVVLQMQGTSIFEQDGQCLKVSPGDCIAYDVSRPHRISNPAWTKHLVVIIPRDLALQHGFRPNDLAGQFFSAREGIGRLVYELINSTFKEMPAISPDCEEDLAESILNLLFLPLPQGQHARGGLSPSELLKRQIKSYIRRNLHDPELCIERIAAALNCTKRYLHMAFASEGTTIAKYIWMVRLENCRHELETAHGAGMTVTDVAFSWGFNSSSHFSRVFKEKFGVSPSHFLR
jgi:AraC-like DNA-binding protein